MCYLPFQSPFLSLEGAFRHACLVSGDLRVCKAVSSILRIESHLKSPTVIATIVMAIRMIEALNAGVRKQVV